MEKVQLGKTGIFQIVVERISGAVHRRISLPGLGVGGVVSRIIDAAFCQYKFAGWDGLQKYPRFVAACAVVEGKFKSPGFEVVCVADRPVPVFGHCIQGVFPQRALCRTYHHKTKGVLYTMAIAPGEKKTTHMGD